MSSKTKDSVSGLSGKLPAKVGDDGLRVQSRASSSGKPASSRTKNSNGAVTRVLEFLRGVRAEIKRVSWPSATMVRNTTIITLIAVIFFGLYLYGIDHLLAFVVQQIDRIANWLFSAA